MTNTETSMREMRLIVTMFCNSINFNEQWILFKAYLNTLHALSDNDEYAKNNFFQNELMNFALVLRNILHHQPAKWHFGKYDVQPTTLKYNISQNADSKLSLDMSLVIQKNTLEGEELQKTLGDVSKKQLEVLRKSLNKVNSHVIVVIKLMQDIQAYVEQYCKDHEQYTERYDNTPRGYIIRQYV